MTRTEVEAATQAGKRFRIAFDDGVTQIVDVHSVDEEGVLHSGNGGLDPAAYWTRFESIVSIEPIQTDLHHRS